MSSIGLNQPPPSIQLSVPHNILNEGVAKGFSTLRRSTCSYVKQKGIREAVH